MKPLRLLPDLFLSSIKSLLVGEAAQESSDATRGKGHNLLRLHEYQHRVIVEIFKISIAGFLAFTLILLGLAVYSLFDPYAPGWTAAVIAALGGVLLLALYRTVQEFRVYRQNYEEITARLRAKLIQQARAASGGQGKGVVEHRLLSALKPKEHSGWDAKQCKHCHKAIEMLATVCQHCGQEQDAPLVN